RELMRDGFRGKYTPRNLPQKKFGGIEVRAAITRTEAVRVTFVADGVPSVRGLIGARRVAARPVAADERRTGSRWPHYHRAALLESLLQLRRKGMGYAALAERLLQHQGRQAQDWWPRVQPILLSRAKGGRITAAWVKSALHRWARSR